MTTTEESTINQISIRRERQKDIQALVADLVGQCAHKNLNMKEFEYVLTCMKHAAYSSTIICDPREV